MAWVLLAVSVGCKKPAGEKPAGLPPLPRDPAPLGGPSAAGVPEVPAAAPGAVVEPSAITGTIVLPSARRGDVGRGDTVFLVARQSSSEPSARGPMVAVKKLEAQAFPMAFVLSSADTMLEGTPFTGDLDLQARVDKDGDPMTRRKGDVLGTVKRVRVGASGVVIALDTLQAEDQTLGTVPPGGMGGASR